MTRIADDFPAIARRLAELQGHKKMFRLPPGVLVFPYERRHIDGTHHQFSQADLVFMLHQRRLVMMKSRSGSYRCRDGTNFFEHLQESFPSARQVRGIAPSQTTDQDIELSATDAARLAAIIAAGA